MAALWALASVLERQLTGHVFIDTGISTALPSPVPLGPRCLWGRVLMPLLLPSS